MDSVLVVGAGVSGLATASLLARSGISVQVFEKAGKVGGRTASARYKGHILDNGFHIMPFYKTSAVYKILKKLQILDRLSLVEVDRISFYRNKFHRYPRGIADILRMSLISPRSRIALLRALLPIAFSTYKKAEKLDSRPLTEITHKLGSEAKSFFDAVCMLAFADTADRVSLGEFVRTMMRANPFRGGTSTFAYPGAGGYDTISKAMAAYVVERGGIVSLLTPVRKIVIKDGSVQGILTASGDFYPGRCVVVSHPAYLSIREFFDSGTFDQTLVDRISRLEKTTSVIEVHFCTSRRIDSRQIVFPVGSEYAAKGIFFVSNMTPSVSPRGEHLLMTGTPASPEDAENPSRVREIAQRMREDLSKIYPGFEDSLMWLRPSAWRLVESVAKEPGLVWKQKMQHQVNGIKGLFFVGDSTVSYGIGTDSAAHSSILCHPKIMSHLEYS